MSISVNLPYPGETFASTIKLDVFDDEGNLVRTDIDGTWYEVTQSTINWDNDRNAVVPRIEVVVRIRRINDESEFLDESDFAVIYREDHFTF